MKKYQVSSIKYQVKTRKLEEMREVLMDFRATGPKDVYYMIRGEPNITVLVPGKIGNEFCKTYGHYHRHNEPESYKILHGEGIFILQKREENPAFLEDVRLIKVKGGDVVEIPKGYGHSMSNVGDSFLITVDDSPPDAETKINDYEPIKKMCGFGYYITEKNGKIKLVKNPRYKKVPKPLPGPTS